jgi:hypothetical protein
MEQTQGAGGSAGTPNPQPDDHMRRLESEIEDTCAELGRTAVELGERLTPSALLADVKHTLRETAVDTTHAAARSARELASAAAERTHEVAAEATSQVRAHPLLTAGAGAGAMWLIWALSEQGRQRQALSRGIPLAVAWTAVWLLWRGRSDRRGPVNI